MSPVLKDHVEVYARNAFFYHYVTNDLRTYNYLETFYLSGKLPGHLSASVDAVSLAFFAYWVDSPSALDQAQHKYITALHQIHAAVQDPDTLAEDATLLSAIFLDLFEKMSNNVPSSDSAWVSHVQGAFTLVQKRGRGQFERPLGIKLLHRLCTNFLISCVASYQAVPPQLVQLRKDISSRVEPTPKWNLMDHMASFVNLREAHILSLASSSELVKRAKNADNLMLTMIGDLPPAWRYETVYIEKASERVFGESFDIYRDRHVTQFWNVVRTTRIFVNEMIRDRASRSKDLHDSELQSAEQTISKLVLEICASVPQLTMTTSKSGAKSYNGKGSMIIRPRRQSNDSPPSMSCCTLLFPLYVAGRSAPLDSPVRIWVLEQLRFISAAVGLRRAGLVAKLLEEGGAVDPWTVYAMLGGYAFVA